MSHKEFPKTLQQKKVRAKSPVRFDVITIFPQIFKSYFQESIIKRAIENKYIEIFVHDIRTFTKDKHQKVDAPPYGGGPGMLMMAQPIYDAIQYVKKLNQAPVLYMSPRGKILTQNKVRILAKQISNFHTINKKMPLKMTKDKPAFPKTKGLILLCGRYEGIDQRVIDLAVDEEISIGKYVLTGGELAAMIIIDAVSRYIPGVLGDEASHEEESFSRALKGKKEYPHYTRPEVFKNLRVPEVLLSGHHAKIKKWREENLK